MTREEAITELNVIYERLSHPEDCENGVYSFRDGDYLEALNMAIKSLEQEMRAEIDELSRYFFDPLYLLDMIDKYKAESEEDNAK